jgi:site-specific DNA-methyltransferase (adenine-specific)
MVYFPQGLKRSGKFVKSKNDVDDVWGARPSRQNNGYVQEFTGYPNSVLSIASEGSTVHPTQKPVALMEYLIRTYTNSGDTVLDNTCGSGTTLVAAINTGRNAIGIERDPDYFQIASERVAKAQRAVGPIVDLAAFRRVVEWNRRVQELAA